MTHSINEPAPEKKTAALSQALICVGSGAGFSSLHISNGRTRTGHIHRENVGALCGVDKRKSDHYDAECLNQDDEFPVWLKNNWGLGICQSCLRALPNHQSTSSHESQH